MKLLIFLSFLLLKFEVYANFIDYKNNKARDYNLNISTLKIKSINSIKNEKLNQFGEMKEYLNQFKTIFQEDVINFLGENKTLFVQVDKSNESINAYATRDFQKNPMIILTTGLLEKSNLSDDGISLIICHELGHHLGGAPYKLRGRSGKKSWSSAEGQADFFATSVCLPKWFKAKKELENNINILTKKISISELDTKCEIDDFICRRVLRASLEVSFFYAKLKNNNSYPEINSRDISVVSSIILEHSSSQCRLDTYLAGWYCYQELNLNDSSCLSIAFSQGLSRRPSCWFFN